MAAKGTVGGERLAAIDVGTNTVLLTVCECLSDGSRRVLFESSEVTRIGHRVEQTGRLDLQAEARTLAHFKSIRESLDHYGVTAARAVGTSALRDASGSERFLAQAERILGVPIEIIFGTQEAELTFRGSTEEFPPGQYFVFDIGGGSTELVVGMRGGPLSLTESLPLGSVRLTERHALSDPPQPAEVAQLRADIRNGLAAVASRLQVQGQCIAVAGTALTLAALDKGQLTTDPAALHGASVSTQGVSDLVAKLIPSIHAQRLAWGISEGRADVILAGAMLCEELLSLAGVGQMIVSNRGVKHGLIQALQASRSGK